MIHPDTEIRFIDPVKGHGVFATRPIPRGTVTWALDPLDRILRPSDVETLPRPVLEDFHRYSFRDREGSYILCWDHGRFVNHSFRANCLTTAYEFEIAVRDIGVGEELTDDYGYLNLTEPFEPLPEKGSRRRQVRPDDLLHHWRGWDRKLREAFRHALAVEQPLWPLLSAEVQQKARAIAEGRSRMDSIRKNYYPDPAFTAARSSHTGHPDRQPTT